MAKKDIIISALACGGKMSCRKQAAEFKDIPTVININSSIGVPTDGGTVNGFKKAANALRKDGSVLKGLFELQNIEPRRIALISYMDGWSFIHEVLKEETFDIDTIIVLEGLNTRSLDRWVNFSKKGRLWMAQSQAPHKTISSKIAAKKIISQETSGKESSIHDLVINPAFEKSISIYSKSENPKTKIYHKDTLIESSSVGNVVNLQYDGKQVQDQTYIQQYVQPRLWKWLAETWNNQ